MSLRSALLISEVGGKNKFEVVISRSSKDFATDSNVYALRPIPPVKRHGDRCRVATMGIKRFISLLHNRKKDECKKAISHGSRRYEIHRS